MGKGINIITPNKKLSSGPYERYQQLKKLQRQSYMHYFYEVGSYNLLITTHLPAAQGAGCPAARKNSHITVCLTNMMINIRTQTTESLPYLHTLCQCFCTAASAVDV